MNETRTLSVAERAAHVYFLTIEDENLRDWLWCGHLVFNAQCEMCAFAQRAALERAGQVDPSLEVN